MSATARLLLLVPLVLVAIAVPVLAATGPALGVGKEVRWSGNAPGYGVTGWNALAVDGGSRPDCQAPSCAVKEIDVIGRGDLFVRASDSARAGSVEVDVVKPDGSVAHSGGGPGLPTLVRVDNAPRGRYKIQILTNRTVDQGGKFTASAELGRSAR